MQAVEALPSGLSSKELNNYANRLLEIVDAQATEDGELYARESKDLLIRLEKVSNPDSVVLETAVDIILSHVRGCELIIPLSFALTDSRYSSYYFLPHRMRDHVAYTCYRKRATSPTDHYGLSCSASHRTLWPIVYIAPQYSQRAYLKIAIMYW